MTIARRVPLSVFVLLLLGLVPVLAEDEAQVVNSKMGYTFTARGLRQIRLNRQDLTVLTAYLDADDQDVFKGSRLEIEVLQDSNPASELGFLVRGFVQQGAEIVERKAVTFAGRSATRALLRHPDGRLLLFVYEDQKPGRDAGAWAVRAHCRGRDPTLHLKTVDAALATFTVQVPERTPAIAFAPGRLFIDRAIGFLIRLDGFEGRITGFQLMLLEMRSLRLGGEHLGTFTLVANHRAGSLEADLPGIRKRLEESDREITGVERLARGEYEAALIRAKYVEGEQKNELLQLVVWGRDAVFFASAVTRPEMSKGREGPLLEAVRSFALLD